MIAITPEGTVEVEFDPDDGDTLVVVEPRYPCCSHCTDVPIQPQSHLRPCPHKGCVGATNVR